MTTSAATAAKSADAFRTISEVAETLRLPQHVLRFWETRFTQIKPLKRGGGRRFYRPQDVELLVAIRHLLYGEGYTIKGVQRILREQGPRAVAALAQDRASRTAAPATGPAGGGPSAPDRARPVEPTDRVTADDPSRPAITGLAFLDDGQDLADPVAPRPTTDGPASGRRTDLRARLTDMLDELAACRRILDAALEPGPQRPEAG